jgi:hypothetical protein
MSKKETACVVAEVIGEVVMGLAVGVLQQKCTNPKLTKVEKVIVDIGSVPACWMLGRAWGRTWFKFCDNVLGTEFGLADKL